jgi:trehalose synthase
MTRIIDIGTQYGVDDYAAVAHLSGAVDDYRASAKATAARLKGRRVWMVNSTSVGGGVAEMLPTMVALLRGVGIDTEWIVIDADDPDFFAITKSLHNRIHGAANGRALDADARACYEATNATNAAFLRNRVKDGDIVVVHDPQPMALAGQLKEDRAIIPVWRCHIGLDSTNDATASAWDFLQPYAADYDHAVFSAEEYIPPMFQGRARVIYPGINPLTPKNRFLHLRIIVDVLCNSALAAAPGPLLTDPYPALAQRLQRNGAFATANAWGDIGLLSRPIVTQVSRWDRLKGFEPLLRAFAEFKRSAFAGERTTDNPFRWKRQQLVRLVLAGPDPASIEDDPEGKEVLRELIAAYLGLEHRIQDDIAIVALPMESPEQNAYMVNALQRASTLVVQNSIREGFGLTVTEAMWKRIPILSNTQACGPRHQIRDNVDGRLARDPTNEGELVRLLDEMLADHEARDRWGRSGQRHVHDQFLVFRQLGAWLRLWDEIVP